MAEGLETTHWYRLEDKRYSVIVDAEREEYGITTKIECLKYEVLKETSKSVLLRTGLSSTRWCRKGAHKQFACPTMELAVESFAARKTRQTRIHRGLADRAEQMKLRAINYYGTDAQKEPYKNQYFL